MKIIANPRAGHKRGARAIRELRLLLEAKGIKPELFETRYPGHATELAQRLAEKGEPRIVIFGGDGTISEVVNATVNTGIELGIISVGTGNDLARSLDLPYNQPEEALEVVLTGGPIKVDVGWEQERCFISTLGLGFPAVIAQEVNKMKYLKGSPAFFIATYKAINHLRATPVKITLDDATLTVNCTSVLIQNTRFCGGGLLMAPAARMDDGLFDVVVVNDIGKVDLMLNFPKIYSGRHLEHPKFSLYRTRSVRIDTPINLSKMFDGDIYGQTPVNAKVLRGAATIIGPSILRR
ncbi:MAG: diacylglycerol kinase family protein [Acidobacteriota bacterium]|nr:diacylglycerol kinase family lipid kinase [Deltaproteobacteria bacterium]